MLKASWEGIWSSYRRNWDGRFKLVSGHLNGHAALSLAFNHVPKRGRVAPFTERVPNYRIKEPKERAAGQSGFAINRKFDFPAEVFARPRSIAVPATRGPGPASLD